MKHTSVVLCGLLAGLAAGCGSESTAPGAAPLSPSGQPASTAAPPAPAGQAQPTAAVSGPLGSKTNPVRCDYPEGERAYLSRLRCPDGSPPRFERSGSVGKGPYGNVLDHYVVTCGAEKHDVFMDMYHQAYAETQPIPGFTIVK